MGLEDAGSRTLSYSVTRCQLLSTFGNMGSRTLSGSIHVVMIDYTCLTPEDLGSDEGDMHDYVDIMPVHATIPRALRTCSCSTTLPWSLRIWALTKRTCMTMFASCPSTPALVFDDAVSCSTTLPRVLRIWALTKRTCVTMLTSCPTTPALVLTTQCRARLLFQGPGGYGL